MSSAGTCPSMRYFSTWPVWQERTPARHAEVVLDPVHVLVVVDHGVEAGRLHVVHPLGAAPAGAALVDREGGRRAVAPAPRAAAARERAAERGGLGHERPS